MVACDSLFLLPADLYFPRLTGWSRLPLLPTAWFQAVFAIAPHRRFLVVCSAAEHVDTMFLLAHDVQIATQ